MDYTENYGLKKPSADDYYNVEDFNENVDIIETELKDRLSCSKGGTVSAAIYFGEDEEERGAIIHENGNLIITTGDSIKLSDCMSPHFYFTEKNEYKGVSLARAFKPAVITVAAYLSDDIFRSGADYTSRTETEDKKRIMQAISACPEGGTVRLLPGEYVISADTSDGTETLGVEITKSINIKGDSAAGVIVRQEGELASPAALFTVKAEDVIISDMTLKMQSDSSTDAAELIVIEADRTTVKNCIFESEDGPKYLNDSIYFAAEEGITNTDADGIYAIKEVRIEECSFNIDYESFNSDAAYYCDIGFPGNSQIKVSGRIYGNSSEKKIIYIGREELDEAAYCDDLVIFGNGAVKHGGYNGEEIRSYGLS